MLRFSSEKWLAYFSLSRCIFWVALIVPAILFGWVYAIAFVSACSLYANAASDFAAYRADRNKEIIQRLDRIELLLKEVAED